MSTTRFVRFIVPLALATAAALALVGGAGASSHEHALVVNVDGPGTITGPGISCNDTGGDCAEVYPTNSTVTLTATPNAGATFAGWGGDCSGSSTCTLVMSESKGVLAFFTTGGGTTRTLSVSVNGSGVVTGPGINCGNGNTDCSETYAHNTPVTLTATPTAGNTFTGWGGACSGASTTCSFVMDASKSVSASFTGSSTTRTLTVSVTGNGTVTGTGISCGSGFADCTETYTATTNVTLTATPNTGATFLGWGGACSGNATTCTVTMDVSKTVTASFSSGSTTQSTLTVSVTGPGRVTGPGISCGSGFTDCSEVYATNTSVTLTATPNAGAAFAGWGNSCTGTSSTCTVVMNTSRAVSAGFTTTNTRALATAVAGSGRISGSGINCGGNFNDCSETYADGTTVTLIAIPGAGVVFLGWGGACGGTGTTCTVVMDANKTVTATFSRPGDQNGGSGRFAAVSLGNPLVVRTSVGWAVTLRFHVNQPSAALLRLSLGGRLVNAFTFSPRRGNVLVGPFHLGTAGLYRFGLQLSNGNGATSELVWNLCLSSNGCQNVFRPAVFLKRGGVTYGRAGNGYLVRVHFTARRAGSASAAMFRGGRRVATGAFTFRAGRVQVDLPTATRGSYRIVVSARDVQGRRMQLTWFVTVR